MTDQTAPFILSFDTSSAHCAVAVLHGNTILAEKTEAMSKGQAERLMGLIDEVMASAGVAFSDVAALGVGTGPGNFTGIRISISAARGLALGLGIPAVGVSILEALHEGSDGPCICLVEARRDQVYVQRFDTEGPLAPPQVVAAGQLTSTTGSMIGAHGSEPVFPVAVAIARIALRRYATTTEKPAPLYLRPADAAPARDAPPVILP